MTMLLILIAAVLPYFICAINPAIIVTYAMTGKDIRTLGSGNAGLTNTIRSVGKPAAALVLMGDLFKGVIAVAAVRLIARYFFGTDLYNAGPLYWLNFVAAFYGALGHAFPVYYKFKGGKSVLVTMAVLTSIQWQASFTLFGIFLIVFFISGYVSLGSLIAGSLIPVGVGLSSYFIYHDEMWYIDVFFSLLSAALLVFMHRENIRRLRNGTEKKMLHKNK